MKIHTASGSAYELENGICRKRNSEGTVIDTFKVYFTKAVPMSGISTMEEVYDLPNGEPEVGKRLYLGGRDSWWLSTEVMRIEKD
jgi:hypothetical protein